RGLDHQGAGAGDRATARALCDVAGGPRGAGGRRAAGAAPSTRAAQGPARAGPAVRGRRRRGVRSGYGGRMMRIATRASELALWQARRVQALLAAVGVGSSLVAVTTEGDRDQRPFAEIGGIGFFTKAVQEAVLRGEADVAVHSYKDLPSEG